MKDEFLTDIEIEKIVKLCEDEVLLEAVRKVLLADIYSNGTLRAKVESDPTRNGAFALVSRFPGLSDENIGQDVRAQWAGVQALEMGIKKLKEYKLPKKESEEESINEAM
jgi:hypothetical protein